MPRVCNVTGKKTMIGMNVSHSMRHTKRTFLPNLQKLSFHSDILNRDFNLRISTSGLRTLTKHGGLDAYVMSKPISRLTTEMAAIKKAIENGKKIKFHGSYEMQYIQYAYNELIEKNEIRTSVLQYKAEHDPLTGLINREAFEQLKEVMKKEIDITAL